MRAVDGAGATDEQVEGEDDTDAGEPDEPEDAPDEELAAPDLETNVDLADLPVADEE